jgi:hypothetical protein
LKAGPILFNAFSAEAEHVDKANDNSHLDCRYKLLRGYAAKCSAFSILQQSAAVLNHKLITLANDQLHAQILNPFQSNFSANRILPISYLFWAGKRLVDYL